MGGISIGLADAGYEVVKAYDAWPAATDIYNHNAPAPVASVCDILSGAGRDAIRKDLHRPRAVDLLAAGPPCKGFSRIRNGCIDDHNPHNRVLEAMPTYVALFRPRMVLIENVPDLARHRDGETLRTLISGLRRPERGLRYRVEHRVYDAALHGVPQARRRMLILAVRTDSGRERLPPESPDLTRLYAALRRGQTAPSDLGHFAERLADPDDLSMTTVRQALSDLPALGATADERPRPYASEPNSRYQQGMRSATGDLIHDTRTPAVRTTTLQRLVLIPPGGCARDVPAEQLNGLSRRYDSAYRRLHPDAPAHTLSTKYDVYHFAVDRALSVRECARLQGIPDHVHFPRELASRRHAYEMIGNAAPPCFVKDMLARVSEAA